jgi:hypothetical protein
MLSFRGNQEKSLKGERKCYKLFYQGIFKKAVEISRQAIYE